MQITPNFIFRSFKANLLKDEEFTQRSGGRCKLGISCLHPSHSSAGDDECKRAEMYADNVKLHFPSFKANLLKDLGSLHSAPVAPSLRCILWNKNEGLLRLRRQIREKTRIRLKPLVF
ncbi:hypothetical protein CEXT_347291 [Caerostris extrusa]|uniref:Uncharacterized protein n=1 Tax=Caerostris extrusa TaxID=172846 RepID=A0AAV4VP14_CAEEX|nr:hypothetical protein CEXT_347291 [Caerostris extrusa]